MLQFLLTRARLFKVFQLCVGNEKKTCDEKASFLFLSQECLQSMSMRSCDDDDILFPFMIISSNMKVIELYGEIEWLCNMCEDGESRRIDCSLTEIRISLSHLSRDKAVAARY